MGICDDVDHDHVEKVRIYILSKNKTGDKQRVCMRNSHALHHKKSSSTLGRRGIPFPTVLTSQDTELNVVVEIRYVTQHSVRLIQRLLGSMKWRAPGNPLVQ